MRDGAQALRSRDVAPADAFDVPGGDAERYDGEKSTEGVVNFIKNLGLGAAMGAPVPGVRKRRSFRLNLFYARHSTVRRPPPQ